MAILFGGSDKSNRMMGGDANFTSQQRGIKFGISSGQWEQHIDLESQASASEEADDGLEKWKEVSSGSSIGREEVEFLPISYRKSSFIRFFPVISLRDIDDAMFLPFLNESLAEKIKSIHIYSNGYKLQEIPQSELNIDTTAVEPNFPAIFDDVELKDQWVAIRSNRSSFFHMRFSDSTPKRLFVPSQVESSLDDSGR